MKLKKMRAFALVPLAASVALAGCGGSGDSPSIQERIFSSREGDMAKQQQLVRECMSEHGFEYTPRDNRGGEVARQIGSPDTEEFVKEFGFGISTMFANEIRVGDFNDDPNQEYRESLSESQKAAYDKALYGFEAGSGGNFSVAGGGPVVAIPIGGGPIVSGGDDSSGDGVQVQGPGGCFGEAIEATQGEDGGLDVELFQDLREMEESIESDPEMVEAYKKWATCMADSGYDYRDRDAAVDELREEFAELTGLEMFGDGGFAVGGVVSITSRPDGNGDTEAIDPFADVDKEKLSQLQEKEKKIALASLDCSEKHVAKAEQKVRERLEEQFLDDHPDLQDAGEE